MEILPITWDSGKADSECLVAFAFEKETVVCAGVDKQLLDEVLRVTKVSSFTGKSGQNVVVYPADLPQKRVVLWGLGKKEELSAKKLREAGGSLGKYLSGAKIEEVSILLSSAACPELEMPKMASLLSEGLTLGAYKFDKFKSDKKDEDKTELKKVLLCSDGELESLKAEIVKTDVICKSVLIGRNLVSHPGNYMTPSMLAGEAQKLAKESGLTCEVWDKKKIESMKMGGLLGVSRGSEEEPRFVILEHKSAVENAPTVVLVGKGITFDSGGISLKPSPDMDKMKTDMGGAAVVISAIVAAAKLNLPVNVVALVPSAENMPSGTACKPGDILTAMSGKTIEVLNTDAEGRLILADALHHAKSYKPDAIVDFATLTGACMVALGMDIIGIMGNSHSLLRKIKSASTRTDEAVWELPLNDDFKKEIESDVADIKNIGSRYGGTITAGAFLNYFVGDDLPWVHCDIAGPTWSDKDKPIAPKGATGAGIRMIVDFLGNFNSRSAA